MSTKTLMGTDSITIGGRIFNDFGHGEVAKITYPTELATVKTGKNGNTIYVQNASGFQAVMTLKLIRGSADDKFMQTQLTTSRSNPTAYTLLNAELAKKIGDGAGQVSADTYILTGGYPTKQVEVASNVEGDVEQALAEYTITFAASDRAIS
jgi:hypothetical protein